MKMAATGGGPGAAEGQGDKNKHLLDTPLPFRLQARHQTNLDRLARYRAALGRWQEAGGEAPMPQPQHFGINLPDLDPAQVLWGAA